MRRQINFRNIFLTSVIILAIVILLTPLFGPEKGMALPDCGVFNCWRLRQYICYYNGTYCIGWKCSSSLTYECTWPWQGQCPFGIEQPDPACRS